MKHTKTSFEPHENLQAAWMHYFLGIDQHLIASSFAINSGRVNEACRAIEYAMKDPKRVLAILDPVYRGVAAPAPELVAPEPAAPELPLPPVMQPNGIATFGLLTPPPWEKQQ